MTVYSKIQAFRGDTIKIPFVGTKTDGSTLLIQLRQTPESSTYFDLELVDGEIIIPSETSRTLDQTTYIVEVEELTQTSEYNTLQHTSLIIKLDTARDYGTPGNGWSSDDIAETIRKTLTPSGLITYLPYATPFTTPSLVINTPTKIVLPVTPKYAKDFAIATGGGAQFTRDATVGFSLNSSSAMTCSANNVTVKFSMHKNGVFVPGCMIQRKVGTGGDVGAISLAADFTAVLDDIFEVYVEVNVACTVTFYNTTFNILER